MDDVLLPTKDLYVTIWAKIRLVCTNIDMHVLGLDYSYTQEVSTHCVSCGQTQTVCFSEGCDCDPVKPWLRLWRLWSAPIGRYQPEIVPMTRVTSLRPSCMVRTICGQPVMPCHLLGGFSTTLPTHPTPPSPPPTHPPPRYAGLKLVHTWKKIVWKGQKSSKEWFHR